MAVPRQRESYRVGGSGNSTLGVFSGPGDAGGPGEEPVLLVGGQLVGVVRLQVRFDVDHPQP
jgi:hypothetical protein